MKIAKALPTPVPVVSSRPVPAQAPPAPPVDEPPAHTDEPANTREVRVNRFVKSLTRESLTHLRYLSSIYAGNMVGTTVGALASTPLAIHLANNQPAVVGGIAIGGAVAGGAIGSLLGYFYEHHHDKGDNSKSNPLNKPGGLVDTLLAGGALLRSVPRFTYPTIYGATPAETQTIFGALDKLPLKDVTASQTMTVIPDLGKTGISGMSQPLVGMNRIIFDRDYLNSSTFGTELVTHEQGHAVDYTGGWGLLGSVNWRGGGFGKAPFISDYASSNRYEDWAESYNAFHSDPTFKDKIPAKWNVIDAASRPTPPEMLVDHPKIRQAGKDLGQALGAVPYLRTGLELAGSLLSPLMLRKGALELQDGLDSGDPARKLQGKMNLSTGFLMSVPGAGPLALGTVLAHQALIRNAGHDRKKLESASNIANGVMALATGPFGMTALAVGTELKKSGIDVSKIDFTKKSEEHQVGAGKMLKGLLATVGGAVGGSIAGVSLGVALSGPNGAAMGAVWGRIAGGLMGLSAYGAYEAFKDEDHQSSPYDLQKSDKIFLAKIAGGAVAGALGGTVLGSLGGQAAGGAIGRLVAGETGGAVGSWLGGAAGTLVGAYEAARLGAYLGRKLVKQDS